MRKIIINLNTLLICIWGVLVVLNGNIFFTKQTSDFMYISKHVSAAFLVGIIIFMKFQNGKIDKIFIVAALFPIYATITLIASNSININLIIVYFVWWLLMFYSSNKLFQYIRKDTFKLLFYSLLICEIYLVFLGLIHQRILWWNGSLVFAMKNPNFFGDLVAISAILSIYLSSIADKRIVKIIYFAVFALNLLLAIGSESTSSILLIISVIVYVWIQGLKNWKRASIQLLIVFVVFLIPLSLIYLPFESLNSLSTGRLLIWKLNVNYNLKNILYWLFGNAKMIVVGYSLGNFDDSVRIEHIDNSYIEIFIRYGVIGFVLFFSPLLLRYRKLKSNALHKIKTYDYKFSIAITFAILLQGLYETNLPSFGNLMNIMLFLSIGMLSSMSCEHTGEFFYDNKKEMHL